MSGWSFETARVSGRLFGVQDQALYLALYTDSAVMAHIAAVKSADAAEDIFGKVLNYNADPAARARYWHLSHRRTGDEIGLLALIRDAKVPTRGELGVMLLPAWQHRGVGLQALTAVVDGVMLARWPLGIDELIGRHAGDNPAAGRMVEALGFERLSETDEGAVPGLLAWRLRSRDWPAKLGARNRIV